MAVIGEGTGLAQLRVARGASVERRNRGPGGIIRSLTCQAAALAASTSGPLRPGSERHASGTDLAAAMEVACVCVRRGEALRSGRSSSLRRS
jgi:hypothetical protein